METSCRVDDASDACQRLLHLFSDDEIETIAKELANLITKTVGENPGSKRILSRVMVPLLDHLTKLWSNPTPE